MSVHCTIQIAYLCTKKPFIFATKLTKKHCYLATFIVFMTFHPIWAHRCASEANKHTSYSPCLLWWNIWALRADSEMSFLKNKRKNKKKKKNQEDQDTLENSLKGLNYKPELVFFPVKWKFAQEVVALHTNIPGVWLLDSFLLY